MRQKTEWKLDPQLTCRTRRVRCYILWYSLTHDEFSSMCRKVPDLTINHRLSWIVKTGLVSKDSDKLQRQERIKGHSEAHDVQFCQCLLRLPPLRRPVVEIKGKAPPSCRGSTPTVMKACVIASSSQWVQCCFDRSKPCEYLLSCADICCMWLIFSHIQQSMMKQNIQCEDSSYFTVTKQGERGLQREKPRSERADLTLRCKRAICL